MSLIRLANIFPSAVQDIAGFDYFINTRAKKWVWQGTLVSLVGYFMRTTIDIK